MRAALLEVLLVYCALPDGMPYRQGMSHLAATLLLHVHEPHLACACLHALLTGYPVLRACASLHFGPVLLYFELTLEQQLPAVHMHLRRHEISSDVYLVRWLLTMFSQSLPLSTCARIWDVVLSDGERALFRAALALLGLLQPMLLAAGYEESVMLLQHLPQDGELPEQQLLADMARVRLPADEYQALLVDAIVSS